MKRKNTVIALKIAEWVVLEWEESILCTLTRIGQMESKEFYCSEYIYNPDWETLIN